MIKLAAMVVFGGLVMGLVCYGAVDQAEAGKRGDDVIYTGVYGASIPELNIALVSFFWAFLDVWIVHQTIGMAGRVLWIPLALSTSIALALGLAMVANEFGGLPSTTWHLLGICVVFIATGGMLGVGMAKERW
ncbi:MAG: hypothetical protein KKB50_19980 [Planctomycetes bacterium]|nr:hypothetical protein [Planctomycetota bacterium]